MNKLLIDEYPLILLPTLAKVVGLHEAIILQQIHYWANHKGPDGNMYGQVVDGVRYIRNTVEQWKTSNFPFLSKSQIYRALKKLEDQKLVISRNDINKLGFDRTKWYTVNYAILHQREMEFAPARNPSRASEETIPETTPEKTKDNNIVIDFEKISRTWADLNFGSISKFESDSLYDLVKDWREIIELRPVGHADKNYTAEQVVYYALKIMGENAERKTLNYVKAILKNWKREGVAISRKSEQVVGSVAQSSEGTYV